MPPPPPTVMVPLWLLKGTSISSALIISIGVGLPEKLTGLPSATYKLNDPSKVKEKIAQIKSLEKQFEKLRRSGNRGALSGMLEAQKKINAEVEALVKGPHGMGVRGEDRLFKVLVKMHEVC